MLVFKSGKKMQNNLEILVKERWRVHARNSLAMYVYLILLAGPTLKVKPDHPISSQQILQTNENGKQNSSPEFILGKTEIYKKIHFFSHRSPANRRLSTSLGSSLVWIRVRTRPPPPSALGHTGFKALQWRRKADEESPRPRSQKPDLPRKHWRTSRGTRKEGKGWDTGGETESGKNRKIKVTETQSGLAPQTLSPPARPPSLLQPQGYLSLILQLQHTRHSHPLSSPCQGPRSVRDGTCDNAGAGQDSGAGGSSCASERPTRAFPAALLRSRPRRETSSRPPFTSASYWLAPEDFRLQSRGQGRPERHATAILLPKRFRLAPCFRRFSLIGEALFFEVLWTCKGTTETQKLYHMNRLDRIHSLNLSVKSTVAP